MTSDAYRLLAAPIDAYRFFADLANFSKTITSPTFRKKRWETHPPILHLCRALLMKRDENSRVLYERKTASLR